MTKEFGSDFHRCEADYMIDQFSPEAWALMNIYDNIRCLANGRLAIEAVVKMNGWRRIWMPAYFCYEVIGAIREGGIEVALYDDNPLREDNDEVVRSLPFAEGDVLLRMNFFGLRSKRSNKGILVPVIEDHTHGIISDWARRSDADYCIASVRKSLPVAAGGIVWSPKKRELPDRIGASAECVAMAKMRYVAMELKRRYLNEGGDKEAFRRLYMESDEMLEQLAMTGMDSESQKILSNFNIRLWTEVRMSNWQIACEILDKRFVVLKPFKENDLWQPFSLTLLCKTADERTALRQYLISHNVFPAILWTMPEESPFTEARDISKRILSVHCDARYSRNDIKQMCKIINGFYD